MKVVPYIYSRSPTYEPSSCKFSKVRTCPEKGQRQEEEEVTEEPKRFATQEMARGFSLFEEALLVFEAQDLNVTRRLQPPFRMQSSATVLSMTRKKELLPRHHWIVFSRG